MFSSNDFKKQVKEWLQSHPGASMVQLQEYCEALIPQAEYQTHGWIVDQTKQWYQYILTHRESENSYAEEEC